MAGRWEGFYKTTVGEGESAHDTRIERHAWQLEQHGKTLSGFYVVELTMISGDGRPYVCSRTPRFSTLLRFELRGRVGNAGIELEELGAAKAKGPCRPMFRSPERYRAKVEGNVLTLVGGGRKQTLYRRTGETTEDLASIAFDADGVEETRFPALPGIASGRPALLASSEPPQDVRGYWVWETRGMLPTGDEKQEREEWHLTQNGNQLSGYYDRAIRQISTDGQAYRCNGSLDFHIVTRYQVTGEIQGEHLVLSEESFEIIDGGPCDDGHRRLDSYQGETRDGELHLIWGVGRQILHRARPDVPTQRF